MRTPKKSAKTKTPSISKSKKIKLSDLAPKGDPKGGRIGDGGTQAVTYAC